MVVDDDESSGHSSELFAMLGNFTKLKTEYTVDLYKIIGGSGIFRRASPGQAIYWQAICWSYDLFGSI